MVASREEDFDLLGIEEDDARSERAGVLRPQGPGRRPQGPDRRQGRGRRDAGARRPHRRAALRRRAATTSRRRSSSRSSPRTTSSTRSSSRSTAARRCAIRVPQRGGKRELLATATLNAQEAFARHKLRRASDHNARARALLALQEALDLPEAPLRIECFDISNLQGTEIVGVDGRDGGRAAEAHRLPAVQGEDARRARTTSRRWKRC